MPDLPLFTATVSVFTVFGLIGAQLGRRSGGRAATWFIWGFMLGPVGWLVPLIGHRIAARHQA
jgi:hypothetical protein